MDLNYFPNALEGKSLISYHLQASYETDSTFSRV